MKRFVWIVFIVVFMAIALLRFAPLSVLRPLHLPDALLSHIRPELIATRSIDIPLADTLRLKFPRPLWEHDTTRQRMLVRVATFGVNDGARHQVNVRRLNYLCTGRDYVAAVDLATRHVVILSPMLQFVRKWRMTKGLAAAMHSPVAMTARGKTIAAVDADGTLSWWDTQGSRKGSFKIDGVIADLDILPDGAFLVHDTKIYPYLLAVYSRNGVRRQQFAALFGPDPDAATLLHQGYVAVEGRDEIALGLINPYRLFFFDRFGRPRASVRVEPEFEVFEPYAEKLGTNKWRVYRQRVVYDLVWHMGLLYVLVAPDPERAASWMEIFNSNGVFLQRFYLEPRAIRLAFIQSDLLILGYNPQLQIERYRIEKIRR